MIHAEETIKKSDEYKGIDLKVELWNQKIESQDEFPFTNVHVEDSLFIVNPAETFNLNVVIALECVFYMKDCQYLSLEKKKFGSGVTNFQDAKGIPSNVNRMGTENYKLADF